MVSKCDLCNKTVKSSSELGRHVRIVHEKQRHQCLVCKKKLRENIHLQITKSCILGRMIDSAPKPVTRKVFMINMIKYVYNKIDD